MSKLSVIIISKNEENMIADCLDSVRFADEVILIDNDSTDRTPEIAKTMGAKVYSSHSRDFSELRNYGLRRAKSEWILYIDADERVSEDLQKEIQDLLNKNTMNGNIAYKIKRKNFYLGDYEWPYIEKIQRLFKKNNIKSWKGILHESPVTQGDIGELNHYLLHYTHRNLKTMLDKTIIWSDIEAQLRFSAHHPRMTWWRFLRVMITAFFDSYIRQKGWKAKTPGFIESMYQAYSMFITYAKLWELQQKKK